MLVTPRPDISTLTTLRVGGIALAQISLERAEDFERLPEELAKFGGEAKVLGGGSNVLVEDGKDGKGLPLVLVQPLMGSADTPVLENEDDNAVFIRVHAGAKVPAVVAWCGRQGFSGLEGLVGIPGHMGGAIAMNAGAYGSETAACLYEVTAWNSTNGFLTAHQGEWECSYRHFSLPGTHAESIISSAVLKLKKSTSDNVQSAMRENMARKKNTQPLGAHTAGCVFKNPAGHSAGKLLDEAGMRGKRLGDMYFSEKHANFLANGGKGTFAASMELIEEARQRVAGLFGIHLDLELRVWTCQ